MGVFRSYICRTEEYGMLRFCVGPHIATPYKSIGKIFAVKSFDARIMTPLLVLSLWFDFFLIVIFV